MFEFFGIILFGLLFLAFSMIKIVKEYERGVVYTLGKYSGIRGPGIQFVLPPPIQTMILVDIRVRTEEIPAQDLISKDNVSVRVSAVLNYRVVDPGLALNKVEHFIHTTLQISQTTLRSVLGKHELDDMLQNRDQLSKDIQQILDSQTDGWGIKVTNVEIKHVDIDPSMIRAIARQAEAERERRAKIINAEGELQAARQLDEAAAIMAQRPETMQLRYLGTLGEFSNGKSNSTIVLPLPMDMLSKVGNILTK
jgi:regulator of protease activity HflC (stomatin/prohibitin superfamily)